jgi:hypothetical protein
MAPPSLYATLLVLAISTYKELPSASNTSNCIGVPDASLSDPFNKNVFLPAVNLGEYSDNTKYSDRNEESSISTLRLDRFSFCPTFRGFYIIAICIVFNNTYRNHWKLIRENPLSLTISNRVSTISFNTSK